MPNVPLSEIPSFVAAALNEHDNELAAEKERQAAFPLFASACKNAGIEVKPGDFTSLSAANLRTPDRRSFKSIYILGKVCLLQERGAYDPQKKRMGRKAVSTVGSPDLFEPGAWITPGTLIFQQPWQAHRSSIRLLSTSVPKSSKNAFTDSHSL